MNLLGWVVLIIVNIPVYFLLGKLFFNSWNDFLESIRFWLTPDIFSAFRGEFWDDWWGELKLCWWVSCCVVCVISESYLIGKILE